MKSEQSSLNAKIATMRQAGEILGEVLEQVLATVKPGISELELDSLAEKLIREKGGVPGFQKVPGYSHATCISVNDVVVHGIPTKRVLKGGDIIGIDCGVFLNGYHTDMAQTLRVRAQSSKLKAQNEDEIDRFLEVGERALFAGIRQARAGNRVGNISQAIQEIVGGAGYSIVRNLVGHGVGKSLHEDPEIPGYLNKKLVNTPLLSSGMTIAVEVIYNMGKAGVVYSGTDDWTILTEDGSLAGLFERTILIKEGEPELLTSLKTDVI